MSDEETCRLCGGPAEMVPVFAGGGAIAMTQCAACGPWIISQKDSELLDSENGETKRCLSERVRAQLQKSPDDPLPITEGLIARCRGR